MPDPDEIPKQPVNGEVHGANKDEIKIRHYQHINIGLNILMFLVVFAYTLVAKCQLDEARKSNDLNRLVAYSNFSSTKKSLQLTQDSLQATKDTLKKVSENVNILKTTQRANLVLVEHNAGAIDRRY